MGSLWFLPLAVLAAIGLASGAGDVTMGVAYDDVTDIAGLGRGCVEGGARGEDGVNYCQKMTPEEHQRLKAAADDLLVLTVRRPGEEAYKRFLRSARVYGYTVKVLGEEGEGVEKDVEGSRRLQLLRQEISNLKKEKEDKLVLYTESVDVVLAGGPLRLVEEVERDGEKEEVDVLLSGDGFCWPDKTQEAAYPEVKRGKKYLNSGVFLARVGTLHKLLEENAEKDDKEGKKEEKKKKEKEEEEDKHLLQQLMTKVYLKEELRRKYKMKIDSLSKVFQNLNGATGDVEVRFLGREAYLHNTATSTVPVVVRGNGHSHLLLNTLGSYLARAWNQEDGCRACWEDMIHLEEAEEWKAEEKKEGEEEEEKKREVRPIPKVTLGIFLERPTPFLTEFLERIQDFRYPKKKIDLYFHNEVEGQREEVEEWVKEHTDSYASVKYISPSDNMKEWHARDGLVEHCLEKDCGYMFVVDAEAQILNPYTLKLLIEQNRPVVAPMLLRPYKAWSNFWGAVTTDGFYARSVDYMEIVQGQRRGLWNVPYISECYLIEASVLRNPRTRPNYVRNLLDPDMALCENLREAGVFMHVNNRIEFGHLINNEEFNLARLNPELWEVEKNRWDWERRYLNPLYVDAVEPNSTVEMPCPDVYRFPVFTERFAKEMIRTFEDYGRWSDGGHEDWRLEGGYESVPTVDIHMRQMGMEAEWLEILRSYIQPMQLKVFQDYNNDVGPPRAIMNFMVRYKPDEQPFLRPHHDTSTYTINVALTRPGEDFEGGGCRFLRYNCSIVDSGVGWVLMHPGRLTHLHEGLPVTKGTRYIIVSFVDP